MNQPQTILAIGGHVGDMELTAGGVLASHALKGDRIVTLALTAGERGVPAGQEMAEYRAQKVREAEAFAAKLKGEAVVLDYADGELPDNMEVRLQVCDVIRRVRPQILITHFKNSMHKDHSATHRIVNDARFFAGLASFQRELPAAFAGKCTMRKIGRTPWITGLMSMWILTGRPMISGSRRYPPTGSSPGANPSLIWNTISTWPESGALRPASSTRRLS